MNSFSLTDWKEVHESVKQSLDCGKLTVVLMIICSCNVFCIIPVRPWIRQTAPPQKYVASPQQKIVKEMHLCLLSAGGTASGGPSVFVFQRYVKKKIPYCTICNIAIQHENRHQHSIVTWFRKSVRSSAVFRNRIVPRKEKSVWIYRSNCFGGKIQIYILLLINWIVMFCKPIKLPLIWAEVPVSYDKNMIPHWLPTANCAPIGAQAMPFLFLQPQFSATVGKDCCHWTTCLPVYFYIEEDISQKRKIYFLFIYFMYIFIYHIFVHCGVTTLFCVSKTKMDWLF